MTRNEFFDALKGKLSSIPEAEREDILKDYEEHFSAGLMEGHNEIEICEKLGNPAELAAEYLEGRDITENNQSNEFKIMEVPKESKAADELKATDSDKSSNEQSKQYNPYSADSNNPYSAQRAGMSKDTAILVIVLISMFAALPIASVILGFIVSLCGTVVGFIIGGIIVFVIGILVSGTLITAGLVLLGLSLLFFSFALIAGITAIIKLTSKLIRWYINGCKNLYEKGAFSS